jgi:hypothetical protein
MPSHHSAYNPCPARGMSILSANGENHNQLNRFYIPEIPKQYEEER